MNFTICNYLCPMDLRYLLAAVLSMVLYSCQEKKLTESSKKGSFTNIQPEFATGFSIEDYGDHKKLTVNTPFQGAGESITYLLVPKGMDLPDQQGDQIVIRTPIETIVCTSTTHVPLLDYLDVENALIGFPKLDYISSSSVREKINRGEIVDLGAQINLNLEMLISIQPDMVMGYSLSGDLTQLRKNSKGVPMGGDLTNAPKGKAPTFMVLALRDPIGGNLDRIQIVKGWLDKDGKTNEKVYDVAWSGDRKPGANGKLPPVGNTVDVKNANWTNTIGASELGTVWSDPDFDPAQKAFYYARVIEIPTPRWSSYDAFRFGIDIPKGAPTSTQERAYTSPIWYTPKG